MSRNGDGDILSRDASYAVQNVFLFPTAETNRRAIGRPVCLLSLRVSQSA